MKKNFCLNISIFQTNLHGFMWIICLTCLTKDTQLVSRNSTDIVLSPICLFSLQNPAMNSVGSKSIIQTKPALELAQGIVEQNCSQYIMIQIIFNQIIFSQALFIMHARLQNPDSTKRSYKNNYLFCK